jgi:hypothetical protein
LAVCPRGIGFAFEKQIDWPVDCIHDGGLDLTLGYLNIFTLPPFENFIATYHLDIMPGSDLDKMDGIRPGSQRTLTPSDNGSDTAKPRDEETTKEVVESQDPNAVGWDGPDDPENPMNWPAKKKWSCIGALSVMTLLT